MNSVTSRVFPEAGLAEDGDELCPPIADGPCEGVLEQGQLLLATDERRGDAAARVVGANDSPRPQWLRATLDVERARVVDLDRARREPAGRRAEQDLARLRRLLQAGGEVHGLACRER